MIGRALLAGALALQLALAPAAAFAPAAYAADDCQPDKGTLQLPPTEPWAQQRLNIKGAWQLTMGKGVRVAVVDSGLDYQHPQIRVQNYVDVTGTGYQDCVGHGTAVAGILVGRYTAGSPFYGVAPDASLIVVKQSVSEEGEVAKLVKGIQEAIRLKAQVINISVRASDDPSLRLVIQQAIAQDIVVVAAAGNVDENQDGPPQPSYPASYPGVLGVGSATPDGRRADSSNDVTPVDVLGPGTDITSTWPGKSLMRNLEGTSFATPYVAGVAVLIRSRFPTLDYAQVERRITETADGAVGIGTGAGMVNPLLAVTAALPDDSANAPVVAQPPPAPLPADAVAKVVPPDEKAVNVALVVTAVALLLAGVGAAGAVLIPLGRRRGWRAARPS